MKFINALVFHKRNWPKANSFLYKCNFVSVRFPLKEKNIKFFGLNKFNILSVYEKDYADGNNNLFEWYKNIINKKHGVNIDSVELITMPRILGYAFNPVSFIFCYYKKKLICTILKVNNTFSENHYYINYLINSEKKCVQNYNIEKLFHVSPFLPRDGHYEVKYNNDQDCISFNIDYYNEDDVNVLETSINGKKIIINSNYLSVKNTFNTMYLVVRVIFLIHYQAVKLFFKKVRFYSKPKQNTNRMT